MIYPDNFEQKIGFDSVRQWLSEACETSLGRVECGRMAFSADFDAVRLRLDEVDEFKRILSEKVAFPAVHLDDISARLRGIRPQGTFLTAQEALSLLNTLTSVDEIVRFFSPSGVDDALPYPTLSLAIKGLCPMPALARSIGRVVNRWGEVQDSASPELADIRRSAASLAGTVASVTRRIIASAVKDGFIEADTSASVRDGRLVIPVPPMYKRKIQGIVHDESASGKTVFIEPAEVVEINNRLQELAAREQREIVRILTALTDEIRPAVDDILGSYDILGYLDFVRAKGRWALEIGGRLPRIEPARQLEWYSVCHPVLKQSLARHGRAVVPLNITLTPEDRILVISGPNAGGKSIALKTVAMVQYMMQCGVLPTLNDNSVMGLFESLFIDIGDDQSLEDDLSTYSSHLRNMKVLASRGDASTLFLIDEFGSGTEPLIGGAIAQALLEQFNAAGMWGVVTTHFQNLKKFAEETPGLINGSMAYDRQQMRPLFTLTIGHPGSSFAIEIARKTGLPAAIIDKASEIAGSDYVNLDKYLLDIARDRRYWEHKRQQIRLKEKKVDEVLESYQSEAETIRLKRKEILSDAKAEAARIIESSNAAIERTIHDIRRAQAEREQTLEARRRLLQAKGALASGADAEPDVLARAPKSKKKAKPSPTPAAGALEPGMNVQLDGQGSVGVIEEVRAKDAVVIFGHLKTTVARTRLKATSQKPSAAGPSQRLVSVKTSEESRLRQLNFRQEIDVRGMRVDEAVQAVTYFIDDALQFNASRVRILHGTGTGALRQYIRQYLLTVPGVRRAFDEDVRLGGAGITVVEL